MSQRVLPITRPTPALLRPAPDHRPTGYTMPSLAAGTPSRSPAGATTLGRAGEPAVTRPDARRVRRSLVALPGGARPDPSLPAAQEWAAMLTIAVFQVVAGRRPMDQLERWLDDLAVEQVRRAAVARRRSRSDPPGPAEVVSVRVQCLSPRVVEVAAHVRIVGRSSAVALRLEGSGTRWTCTALDLGPVPGQEATAA